MLTLDQPLWLTLVDVINHYPTTMENNNSRNNPSRSNRRGRSQGDQFVRRGVFTYDGRAQGTVVRYGGSVLSETSPRSVSVATETTPVSIPDVGESPVVAVTGVESQDAEALPAVDPRLVLGATREYNRVADASYANVGFEGAMDYVVDPWWKRTARLVLGGVVTGLLGYAAYKISSLVGYYGVHVSFKRFDVAGCHLSLPIVGFNGSLTAMRELYSALSCEIPGMAEIESKARRVGVVVSALSVWAYRRIWPSPVVTPHRRWRDEMERYGIHPYIAELAFNHARDPSPQGVNVVTEFIVRIIQNNMRLPVEHKDAIPVYLRSNGQPWAIDWTATGLASQVRLAVTITSIANPGALFAAEYAARHSDLWRVTHEWLNGALGGLRMK